MSSMPLSLVVPVCERSGCRGDVAPMKVIATCAPVRSPAYRKCAGGPNAEAEVDCTARLDMCTTARAAEWGLQRESKTCRCREPHRLSVQSSLRLSHGEAPCQFLGLQTLRRSL